MNSGQFPTQEQVLDALGDDLLRSLVQAVDAARDDYRHFREDNPRLAAAQSATSSANFIHSLIWERLHEQLEGREDVSFYEQGSTRELAVGMTYVIRVKRHSLADAIRSYPTAAALTFWYGGAPTLDGTRRWNLALGYRWDSETKAFGEAVLSFRTEMGKPVWVAVLSGPQDSTVAPWRTSPTPTAPNIDLSSVLHEADEEEGIS